MRALIGRPRLRLVLGLALGAALMLTTYAFTASNTVPTATLGEGAGAISGYTISAVSYTLNSSNPQNIDGVTLTTSALANSVKIKLVSGGSTWYACSATNGPTNTTWSCATTSPQATVGPADELRVIAAQ